jgi:prolyl oligopeptidase
MLAELNRAARAGAVTDTLHGMRIEDPYRSLEEDTPATRAWIDAQTERTTQALTKIARPEAATRLDQLLSIGTINGPRLGGDRIFYLKREGDREQPALYVIDDGRPRAQPLIDPLTHGERAALDWYYPSPGGRYVAFGISQNGDERSTLHVVEVSTGRVLDDRIQRTKWCGLSWLHSEDGFYYTRYPKEGEPNFDAEHEDTYYSRVFFHRLGQDPAADPLVYGGERGTDFPGADVSDDDRHVVINVFRGWSATDVHLFDRGVRRRDRIDAPTTERPLAAVTTGREHITVGRVHRGALYLFTNEDAPRYRIATVDPNRAADRTAWTDIVPQRDATIEDWTIASDRLVVHSLADVRSKVELFRLDGRPAGEVALPTRGSVEGLAATPQSTTLAFAFSSYLHPPSLLSYDVRRGAVTELDRVAGTFDFSQYELEQARVPSTGGVEINVYVLRRRDAPRDGSNPVLLGGYGGFNVSLLPVFTRNALYWLERGGVYAVANLRGGGELGEDWHQAGNLLNKVHVFEDFEAVIRWLTTSNLSRPDKIAITGGSNGGLLMGAMITRCPDTFRAAASYVGLYDMVRYHRFPPAELWVTEYGNADADAEQAAYLLGYSPYHQVRPDTAYPSVLIETADHDSRVHWAHSTKFAARLQEAQSNRDRPIHFYMVRQVGHGAGTRLSDTVERYVRQFTFLEHELGMAR